MTGLSGPAGSVFTVPAGVTATVSDLGITGGQAADGGGVDNAGTLTMDGDYVGFNSATFQGGGIYSSDGASTIENSTSQLILTRSEISANTAGQNGGGIYDNHGTIQDSAIRGNQIVNGSALSFGGGIAQYFGSIVNSTISGNAIQAADGSPTGDYFDGGGGVWALGALHIRFNTITGNSAGAGGGDGVSGDGFSDFVGNLVADNNGGNCSRPSLP